MVHSFNHLRISKSKVANPENPEISQKILTDQNQMVQLNPAILAKLLKKKLTVLQESTTLIA